jgi:hypothetical protein
MLQNIILLLSRKIRYVKLVREFTKVSENYKNNLNTPKVLNPTAQRSDEVGTLGQ